MICSVSGIFIAAEYTKKRDGDDGSGDGGEKETGILLAGDGAFNIHIPNENVQQRPWLNITRNF